MTHPGRSGGGSEGAADIVQLARTDLRTVLEIQGKWLEEERKRPESDFTAFTGPWLDFAQCGCAVGARLPEAVVSPKFSSDCLTGVKDSKEYRCF